MLIGILFLLLQRGHAADVQTLIDMSTREGAACFSAIAAAQAEEAGHLLKALYFTDTHANCIRQWTSTGDASLTSLVHLQMGCRIWQGSVVTLEASRTAGEVDTLAGQCTHSGDVDGDASEALFSTAIDGVACLSNCSILVADPSSRTVRVITPDGSCPGQHDNTRDNGGWRHKKPLVWTAGALGVVAALGVGTLLLRPLVARSLRDRISRKRANVEEASHATRPSESTSLKGKVMPGCLVDYDDSAYRQPSSSCVSSERHQQASLITLDSDVEDNAGSSTDNGQTASHGLV